MKTISVIEESPVGRQLTWYLNRLASAGEGATEADRERFAESAGPWVPEDVPEAWRRFSARIGPFDVRSVEEANAFAITLAIEGTNGKRWRLSCRVEDQEPYRISEIDWQRLFEVDVNVRVATEADAAALSEVERRCPIVLADRSITFDRGDDYFAFARLMEDVTVALGFVDGVPAAINCGAVHSVRIGGVKRRVMTAIHLRILPEHQRKGLWGAVSRVMGAKYPPGTLDCGHGYVSVDNAAMQRGFANTPDKWEVQALRALIPCASSAGPAIGRPASPRNADRIVEILNATHEAEEMYLPYTVESLSARFQRAPSQYSWDRLWMTDGAVVGVWPAGHSIRVIVESDGTRTESRRGLVLDYGFLPDAEDEFEGLLRAWCAWLQERGLDTLSIFTSQHSPGNDLLRRLATQIDAFEMWTPGLPPPQAASDRGLYVDQIYF